MTHRVLIRVAKRVYHVELFKVRTENMNSSLH